MTPPGVHPRLRCRCRRHRRLNNPRPRFLRLAQRCFRLRPRTDRFPQCSGHRRLRHSPLHSRRPPDHRRRRLRGHCRSRRRQCRRCRRPVAHAPASFAPQGRQEHRRSQAEPCATAIQGRRIAKAPSCADRSDAGRATGRSHREKAARTCCSSSSATSRRRPPAISAGRRREDP
ncbi:hypothetical protein NK6_2099 [Bradyrhizobium diazoefficiens]|uniref:Uncharacterized protein n=1 Tax=Bradyrhizobium diazoefficiens TaxID=1355477 RepID=A0A0E4FSB8_9BRAD|nr:hypothetical protein NK6_2099 [Bradyrhizobium diazoefficiens]